MSIEEKGEKNSVLGMGIDLNRKPPTTRISEFLSDLSIMDDDYKRVMELENFIFHLEDERKKIIDSPYQFVFSLQYLNEAIDRFKELKRVCEVQALSKRLIPCKSNFDRDARTRDIPVINLVSDDEGEAHVSVRTVTGLNPIITYSRRFRKRSVWSGAHQNGNGGAPHMTLGQRHTDPSIHGGTPASLALRIQSKLPVRSVSTLTAGQEPPVKQRRIWSDHVVNTLGGRPPAVAPKNVQVYMKVADITEDEFRSHMLLQKNTQTLPQSHNILMASQGAMNVNRNTTKSESQQIPLRIGGPSNAQMAASAATAAAAAGKEAQDRLKMREMLIPSGTRQRHFHVGEPSNRGMAKSANKGKFV